AVTRTSRPDPSGSGRSTSRAAPAASRATARTAVSYGGARGALTHYELRLTGNETSLRLETPPSTFSPDFRARTNTASSCWRADAGKRDARCSVTAAQPSEPVVTSAGTLNCSNGTAVT